MKNTKANKTVWEGTFHGGLQYLAQGSGSPLVIFNTVTPSPDNPRGLALWGTKRFIKPFTDYFTVYTLGRKPDLKPGISMADLANDYAHALRDAFNGEPVNILGFSTSGSIALQFAADYPELVQRLVIAAATYRLGTVGRDVQKQYADGLAKRNFSQAYKALAPLMSESQIGQGFWGGMLWGAGRLMRIEDPDGMVAMLEAEDRFDLGDRLEQITAPTLLIGGEQDLCYPPDLMKEMAERIPHAHLKLYEGKNHNTVFLDRRFYPDIIAFLGEEHS